jgi:PST family polysaccharide transporter
MSTKKILFKGVSFMALANYSSLAINLIISAILARLLSPSDFGVVAIATVFIAFFYLLSDAGIGPAIVQYKELSGKDISNIFGFTFWTACLLSVIFFFLAPVIALFYEKEILINICRILSIQVFVSTLNIVPNALLMKEKKFNIVAYRKISIQVFCGIIAILAAIHGAGLYALLIAPVFGGLFELMVNVYFSKIRITVLCSFNPIKQIFSFSVFQFSFNFINYFGRNLDKLIIGKSINLTQLGFYEKSYRLMMLPVQNITGVVSPVLHPVLSDFQNNPEKIYKAYVKLTGLLAHIAFPVAAILFFTANELILLTFGSQWEASVSAFKILSVTVALQIPMVTSGAILQSLNQTKTLFILGTVNVIIAISGLLTAIHFYHTIEAICIAGVITSFISFINSFWAMYKYAFHKSFGMILEIFIMPLLCYIIQFIILYPLSNIMNYGLWLSFFIKTLIWIILSFFYFQFFTEYKPVTIVYSLYTKITNQ